MSDMNPTVDSASLQQASANATRSESNPVLQHFGLNPAHCFIGGQWRPSEAGQTIELANPSTGEPLCVVASGEGADIDAAVAAAQISKMTGWGRSTNEQRSQILKRLAKLVSNNANELAKLEALDVGKPLQQAKEDAIALAQYFEFYSNAIQTMPTGALTGVNANSTVNYHQPLGVTGHILSWQYPMREMGRAVGAALVMGNACIVKPAEEACLTVLAVTELASHAGLPTGALNVVPGLDGVCGNALSSNKGINQIFYTGSLEGAVNVQTTAAQSLIPVTFEVGGRSTQIVFNDADIDAAIPHLLSGAIHNAGQSNVATPRLFVQRGVYENVLKRLADSYKHVQVGNAMHDLDVGPLVSSGQKERAIATLQQAVKFRMVAEGVLNDKAGKGYYVLPALFTDVPANHDLVLGDTFGPMQIVVPFEDEDDVLAITNNIDRNAMTSLWTNDVDRQTYMARSVMAEQAFVNAPANLNDTEQMISTEGKPSFLRDKAKEAMLNCACLKSIDLSR